MLTDAPKFILSGDVNQFAPIGNMWRNSSVAEDAFERSSLIHTMASGNIIKLEQCMRSESSLFDFYSAVLKISIKEAMLHTHRFNYQGECRFYLVISHCRRVQINRKQNEIHSRGKHTLYIGSHNTRAKRHSQQSMHLYEGIELLGCTAKGERLYIRNGVLYTVSKIIDEHIFVNGKMFDKEQIKSIFRLSYARAYASCQGCEFDTQPVCFCDTKHPQFSIKHLYVGLSRCRNADLIRVE
jgi:hypothetical protein